MYRDTSYDTPGGELLDGDRELRIREIEGADGSRRALLTYKGPGWTDRPARRPSTRRRWRTPEPPTA
ncbi:CYTH domain-containing protein [Kitasatospora sp. NPDC057904]|uniref:CYTH domain-containing protein n=1 Tax=Kitasatospora sp. NPDC057904 TaxID=3346275 RepID=UPI0036DE86B8